MSKQSKYIPILSPLASLFLGRKSGAIPTSASHPSPLQCTPVYDDCDAWRTHWASLNQSWRTEPEIDTKRQEELSTRRVIVPDVEKGIYPFRGMKLNRADVEWLLATHENGRG